MNVHDLSSDDLEIYKDYKRWLYHQEYDIEGEDKQERNAIK